MTVQIVRGDARALPLADNTVDLVCTSPPYFALRSYTDQGEHYGGQIGSEATPAEWLAALLEVTAECVRVLKPSGSLFVNLGDKYAGGAGDKGGAGRTTETNGYSYRAGKSDATNLAASSQTITYGWGGMRPKSLMGLPWRYALHCIDDLGLILRAEIVWCLSGGARVYARTPTGDRPVMLRDLARAYSPKNVQLWNGQRWTQVRGWNKTPDDEDALELELRSGERIGCTPGHRWPTQRGVIRADEVGVGDVIATARLPEPATARMPALLPDEDIGWLVGLYVAEGSRGETTVQFAGHVNETARHARLARIAAALDGSCAVYQTGENTVTANLRGAVIVGVIDRYVSRGTAKTKRLRHAAWQRSNTFLAAVVDGYLSGDGHFDAKNNRWRLGFTENDEWAADLRTLSARLSAGLRLRRHNHRGFGQVFPGWRGEWRWQRSTHHNAKPDGEVVAIRRSRARDFYDVGVADDPHLFALASGVLTHNSKPNGLPESVTDRVRRSHESFFHFVQQPRYYSAVDEIRDDYTAESKPRGQAPNGASPFTGGVPTMHERNPLGKLPGSVWTIPSEPLTVPPDLGVDHFAAYPLEWPRRIIQGWCPAAVCSGCGEGRRPVTTIETPALHEWALSQGVGRSWHGDGDTPKRMLGVPAIDRNRRITGYVCACTPHTDHPGTGQWKAAERGWSAGAPIKAGRNQDNPGGGLGNAPRTGPWREYHFDRWGVTTEEDNERGGPGSSCRQADPGAGSAGSTPGPPPTTPGVVLDPFGGTGTTALAALALGRNAIHVDLSADYNRIATWRTTDRDQLAKAMHVVRSDAAKDADLYDMEPLFPEPAA